jgi:hypothetical protein
MTLEQCKFLYKNGINIKSENSILESNNPELNGKVIYPNEKTLGQIFKGYDFDAERNSCFYFNPTAEEALAWVAGKLNQIINVRILIKHVMIGCHVKDGMYFEFIAECSLSDAVYALIVWAHENKLLEA